MYPFIKYIFGGKPSREQSSLDGIAARETEVSLDGISVKEHDNKETTPEVIAPTSDVIANMQTANGAASLSTSENALLNLFYKLVRGVSKEQAYKLANEAAKESLLNTLKIIAYVRDIRGGKGERDIGRMLFEWLQQNSDMEKQLIHNMWLYLDKFGRYDDMMHLSPKSAAFKEYIKLIGEQLKADIENDGSISLVAKWVPSESSAVNRKTNFTYRLARSMKIGMPELRKKYLTPLRAKIGLLEQKMCTKDWPAVNYETLPSQALNRHTLAFTRNDEEKYHEYLKSLENKTSKVNVGALHPHEIIKKYVCGMKHWTLNEDALTENQWKTMMENLPQINALVLSDVSSSMYDNKGLPILISITLGILLSSVCSNPEYKNKVLTFELQPQLVELPDSSLLKKYNTLRKATWGGSTNLCAAFDTILQMNSVPEQLIIVSDMQFNEADGEFKITNYEAMKIKFESANKKLPHVVFWNVNGKYQDYQALSNVPGVSMVSGFSIDILDAIIKGKSPNPYETMMNVLNRERYSCITLT